MDKRLEKLKAQYKDVPIPQELDQIVENGLKRTKKRLKPSWVMGIVAAAMLLFTASINASPTFANNLAQIPGLSAVVKVLSFTTIDVKDGNYEAKIEVPKITGDSEEIQALNAQYEAEGMALYEQYLEFTSEMDGGHYAVNSGYEVKTENEQILSFGRYVLEIVGSSSTVMQYTTIDKEKQIVITLPSLFKDESYIETISTYIAQTMREEMNATNQEKMYWVSGVEGVDESYTDVFESIAADQSFYITENGKLVIAFDKYEVAPGYMGLVEFEIPTELIENHLMSNTYIK